MIKIPNVVHDVLHAHDALNDATGKLLQALEASRDVMVRTRAYKMNSRLHDEEQALLKACIAVRNAESQAKVDKLMSEQ